ncbi:glycosyl hydrolase family 65 protein [Lapidilactobacillus luobeiensis]|uniref:glycosyl hydrolase family 65 protein n=1 Tax=Lapidilactobacillus luobeiensis TaxID=2950371 RepID=UPI0021C38082|nr:glycosyl hydrolase family 65 protein [Lapidilactobacillus luobeiensis]
MKASDWQIAYHDISKGVNSYGQESILTLGNGYLGWRGAPLLSSYSDDHYPGLYVAGIFNQTTTAVNHRDIVNEDMVNLPNPQLLRLRIDGEPVTLNYDQRQAVLQMDQGVLTETLTFPAKQGHLYLETKKVVDPINYHRIATQVSLRLDFSAKVEIQNLIDGTIQNRNVARYREFNSQEFKVTGQQGQLLVARTLRSGVTLVVGGRSTSEQLTFKTTYPDQQICDEATIQLPANETLTFERVMAVATSYQDQDPITTVQQNLDAADFQQILASSQAHWRDFWQKADVRLTSAEPDLQRLVRFNIFQLHQAAQDQANPDLDASVGSRGLTGEGYRGHIFWDEIFFLPYYAATTPKTAAALLHYRLKRLPAAKKNARSQYEHGAMYPWQSAMSGDEQSQIIHLNPMTHRWYQDNSRLQRHVSLAIVYNLWYYTQVTGDQGILAAGGLQLLLETSKFWLNKVTYDGQRYHLSGVMGPDEFHEAYPHTQVSGLQDNAYTNIMLVWSLNWLLALRHQQSEIFAQACQTVDFSAELLQKATDVAHNLSLHIDDQGVIEQYQRYFELQTLDLDAYAKKYGDIHRIDRILKAEGKSSNDYQVDKQADSLMAVYNLGAQQVEQIVRQLGYQLPQDWLQRNRDYYLARTVHGSTVSRPVFAYVDLSLGELKRSLDYLVTAIKSDYIDIQGGTTAEGIHTGVMGGTLAVIERGFAGLDLTGAQLTLTPHIPAAWQQLKFQRQFHGTWFSFDFHDQKVVINADHDAKVIVQGQQYHLSAQKPLMITLM